MEKINRWLDLVGWEFGGTPVVGCFFVFVDVSVWMRFWIQYYWKQNN